MNLRDLPAKAKERWLNFTQTQKIATVLLSLGIVVCLFYSIVFLVQPKYAPLFTDLEIQEAGQITENLKAMNVKYKTADQGRTILVPESDVYELRMQLASDGVLPGGGQGFELFDQTKLAQTDFEQQVVFQRALQEELRRTIVSLEAVDQARVHLVLPTKSVFIEEEGTASASVVLKLKPLAKLQPSQVQGISDLLIGSVEGLLPENLHIIDTNGNVLNDFIKTPSDPSQMAGSVIQQQQQLREEFEKRLEQRLKQFLTPVYGPGKTVAMVTVDLDFSKVQTTRTEVLPGQPISEQTESSSGSNTGYGSPVGTTSQMPGSDYPIVGGGEGEYEHESAITNYETGQEVIVVDQPPGAIRRISTSVIVDSNVGPVDQEAIQQIVSTAIGFEPARGDDIIVQTMPFDTSAQDAFAAEGDEPEELPLYTIIGIAAAILILLLVLLAYFIRRRRARQQQLEEEMPVPVAAVGDDTEEEVSLEPLVPDPKTRAKDLAKKNPDEVAQVLKLWLKE
ncbi:flagellar basal-body MS-ring/collar protein FliF [Desulfofalx alkaliphila]|uniref:flagellar basal-body MS-ring/collar protein FliF n=1 Tax=Desulfofalx alkaliphila TaxID=105483 RepID=UPI0004E0F39B|nr:flagellar basal-body MS-ring/collar protein FliF [Desulfofalx alkaliphila]